MRGTKPPNSYRSHLRNKFIYPDSSNFVNAASAFHTRESNHPFEPRQNPQARAQCQNKFPSNWHALIDVLDELGLGFEVWNPFDQLLAFNKTINQMQPGLRSQIDLGTSYETLLRKNIADHKILVDPAEARDWLSHRLNERHKHNLPSLYSLPGDHWVHSYVTKAKDGFLLDVWIDVTQFIRKSRVLEAINRELAFQSTTDGLTGIANRRRFDQAFNAEQSPGLSRMVPMSLLMIDIDHFKKYNDHYGHVAGDKRLRDVADILARCSRRSGDLLARYGGEEFVLFLPSSDLECATEIAQECLHLLEVAAIPHDASPSGPYLSMSIGVATLMPETTLSASYLLIAADRAMYRAKKNGRNCFCIAQERDWSGVESDTESGFDDCLGAPSVLTSIQFPNLEQA